MWCPSREVRAGANEEMQSMSRSHSERRTLLRSEVQIAGAWARGSCRHQRCSYRLAACNEVSEKNMATRLASPCAVPGCPNLASHGGRCAQHKTQRERGTAHERGYSVEWQRFREWFLRCHPVCADCGKEFATEVHHLQKLRDRPDLRLVETNCLALSKKCHQRRTNRGE